MNKIKTFAFTLVSFALAICIITPISADNTIDIETIKTNLYEIGVDDDKIDSLSTKIINNELIDSLNDSYNYIEPISVKEEFDGRRIEEYVYPDGSKKILEIIPEEYSINNNIVSRSSFTTWIENVWYSSGTGYSNSKVRVNGSYGIVTMSYYAEIAYIQGAATRLTRVYEPGILVAGPGVNYTITEQPNVVRDKPSSLGHAEAVMKIKLTGDYYTGTYALRFFVKSGTTGHYARLGLNKKMKL